MPARKHPNIFKKCLFCNKIIKRPMRAGTKFKISWYSYQKMKFCSHKCRSIVFGKNHKGINNSQWKGGKPKCINCGIILSLYKRSKRCRPCWYTFHKGKNHSGWKEKPTNYKYIHQCLRNFYGNPVKCDFCNKTGRIEYAKKTEAQYTRNREDYFALCSLCHKTYDK